MIRVKKQHRFHVSNRMAMIAAVLLAFTAYMGLAHDNRIGGEANADVQSMAQQSQDENTVDDSAAERRRFNVGLLLFKNG